MSNSQSNSSNFSVRIVSIDHYMSPPIPGVDTCYSSFQGGKVNEVPVIRIYGSTPAGQKTCLHVHRALPYLYVPCSDLSLFSDKEGDAFTHALSLALEKALKLKGSAGSKRQHVHGCSLVRARKFYGYHKSEELFAKIYLYHPQDISRAASLLLGGAVLDKCLQPHESHVPFLLQFLIDYNLYGMGHLHVSKMKFRHPVPEAFSSRKANFNRQYEQSQQTDSAYCMSADFQADSSGDSVSGSLIWLSSTIPDGWIWQFPSQDEEISLVKRQSICELEGDATVDDILNQQVKLYSSLSQTLSDVKMVQSLIPIWEEFERGGRQGATAPPPVKPPPEVVLKALSDELEYESKLMELGNDAEYSTSSPFENDTIFSQTTQSSNDQTCMVDVGQANPMVDTSELMMALKGRDVSGMSSSQDLPSKDVEGDDYGLGRDLCPQQLSTCGFQSSQAINPSNMKSSDHEALRLLKWLASSQAAEDINSDDELVRETILSPLLPATTIDKILEKADMDLESASQQECQDILDSVDDPIDIGGNKESIFRSHSKDRSCSFKSSSTLTIPQVDGSSDDQNVNDHAGKSSTVETKVDFEKSQQDRLQHDVGSSFTRKSKRKGPLWSTLPFTSTEKVEDALTPVWETSGRCDVGSGSNIAMSDADKGSCCKRAESTIVECSVRDLMRRKRSHRGEPSECETPSKISSRKEFKDNSFPGTLQTDDGHDSSPLSASFNPKSFLIDESTDSHEKSMDTEPFGAKVPGSESMITPAPPSGNRGTERFPHFLNLNNQISDVRLGEDTAPSGGDSDHKDTCIAGPSSSMPVSINIEASTIGTMGYSFYLKPPVIQWTDEPSQDALPAAFPAHRYSAYEKREESVEGVEDECMPFFVGDCLEERENSDILGRINDTSNDQEGVMGIPTYFHNDGSCLYMLTPAISPPSRGIVSSWLLDDGTGSILGQVKKEDQEGHVALVQASHTGMSASQDNGNKLEAKQCGVISQDISQISGPDAKSKLTPLSQTGFRDPASFGAGQQLTLFSIEVQAESRGDLRPDPRFDAINFIILVLQEDDDSIFDTYILLRSDTHPTERKFDGMSDCKLLVSSEEKHLLSNFMKIICSLDPDILMGWDVQGGSLGFLAERAAHLGIGLLNSISRTPSPSTATARESTTKVSEVPSESRISDPVRQEDAVIEDEWGRTHASGVHVAGRIVLNVWRLVRGEVKLNVYTAEAVAEAVLRRKIPHIHWKILTKWFLSGPGRARHRCIEYFLVRAKLNLQIMNHLDLINRTSELARVFGIDFFSVLSRGSQFRVESMLLRLAHSQNYLAISPGSQQVASQPAMECIPLVMEPESGFYADPVIVLDFQSLYPSMIIAYNLCYSTCLGKVVPSKPNTLGVSSYSPDLNVLRDIKHEILLTPNGVMYVPSKVREGVLPRLLDEILSTRIMVKQAMKKLSPSQQVLQRLFNARQLALKLIANVTYGYTAAGFSGRMPCAELADSIVQCGRRTLENAISLVNTYDKWRAKVIYGDTDSMFVLLPGRSVSEAFEIGNEIASAVTAMNPVPVTLKMEKVYHPCFLLTKKRYVGYSYETPGQVKPVFDAKGIETIRRDTCEAVSKTLEQSLRLFFEHQDIYKVKTYLLRQWKRILSGRVSLADFIFAKEVRLGTYSTRTSSLPPAAIVATKAMRADPRAEPRYAERIPYVVVHGEPGARLVDMVVDPLELLSLDSPFRLNDLYYINKQIIPALQRVFGLVGADLKQWFLDMPRPVREAIGKRQSTSTNSHRTRIDFYYLSKHCILCGELVQASAHICDRCLKNEAAVAVLVAGRTSRLEREIQHLAAICRHCGGGDWVIEGGVKCTSLACSVFYERRKVQKELHSISSVATDSGFYPKCMVEWF